MNKDQIVAAVIAQIEGQNWSDPPLTEDERNLIGMAVAATMALLKQK